MKPDGPEPIRETPLSAALGVNSLVICDCGYDSFRIGLAYNPTNGNNFIRILECTDCGKQMPATHQSDAALAPSLNAAQ
jgi:hypothetical protein